MQASVYRKKSLKKTGQKNETEKQMQFTMLTQKLGEELWKKN